MLTKLEIKEDNEEGIPGGSYITINNTHFYVGGKRLKQLTKEVKKINKHIIKINRLIDYEFIKK